MTNLTFNAIDVETANADRTSICQIGIVQVGEGEVKSEWETLVDPEDWFDPYNTYIHGIDSKHVKGAPTMPKIREELGNRLTSFVLVSHSAFDRSALDRVMLKYDLEQLQVRWLDSAQIVRRTWPYKYANTGYSLKKVASDLGISFKHHNALEDARAAATITLRAMEYSGIDVDGWLDRVKCPIFDVPRAPSVRKSHSKSSRVKLEGDPNGPFHGEICVFTGKIQMARADAAIRATAIGCAVDDTVTQRTTILVVGTHNKNALVGYDKSRKHQRAEDLVSRGQEIKILSEDDFLNILNSANNDSS